MPPPLFCLYQSSRKRKSHLLQESEPCKLATPSTSRDSGPLLPFIPQKQLRWDVHRPVIRPIDAIRFRTNGKPAGKCMHRSTPRMAKIGSKTLKTAAPGRGSAGTRKPAKSESQHPSVISDGARFVPVLEQHGSLTICRLNFEHFAFRNC